MPAKGPVSLTRQTIYCFIPIMNWYAAYNIKKFRKYLLIAIIVELSLGAMYASLIPEYDKSGIKKGAISEDINDLEINWTEIIFRTDQSIRDNNILTNSNSRIQCNSISYSQMVKSME